jgi:hypothetical protein
VTIIDFAEQNAHKDDHHQVLNEDKARTVISRAHLFVVGLEDKEDGFVSGV